MNFLTNLIFSHAILAYLSLMLLLTRGVLAAKRVDWRQYKLLKIAPHIVDSLLLCSGVAIVGVLANNGITFDDLQWILPKLMFLVLYIIFTVKAFKKAQPFSLKHFLLAVVSLMLTMFIAATH